MIDVCGHCGSRVLFISDKCPSCGVSRGAAQELAASPAKDIERYDDILFDGFWDQLPDSEILSKLVDAGCPEEVARRAISDERRKRKAEALNQARKRVKHGLVVASVGIAITAGTYVSAVSSETGGTYVVAWGAILYGIIDAVRGWSELSKA